MKEQMCKIDLPNVEGFEDTFEFRHPREKEYFRDHKRFEIARQTGIDCNFALRWILRKKQEWVTPTDEDAKGRPWVQVKNIGLHDWVDRLLIAVDHDGTFATIGESGSIQTGWSECRMKKEYRK